MKNFVENDSVVRKIWGKSDTILFIFAGASAEFALNKAVDWLYFTGKLPSDPLGRLFLQFDMLEKLFFHLWMMRMQQLIRCEKFILQ